MIRADQIPPEALEAARKAFSVTDLAPAIAAALAAWPRMRPISTVKAHPRGHKSHKSIENFLVLPLPQEGRDD